MDKLYTFNPKALWSQFWKEHFAFWMMCAYLILQYFDPLRIYRVLDFLPMDRVTLCLALLTLPLDPRRRWVKDPTTVWMTLFWLVTVVSSAFATYPSISWSHWFEFFEWYVIYLLIINTVNTSERYFIFLTIFLLANFKMSIFGARTWITRGFGFVSWGIEGPPGFFQNSADLSTEMLMFAPVAFELALFVKPRVKRVTFWFLMVGAVSGAMTVLGASSRGAQLALTAQATWIAIQRKLKLKVLLAVALLAGIGWALLPAAEKARFTTAGTDNTSVQRLYYWTAGLKMIEHHPILGVGFFNFSPLYAVHDPYKLVHGTAELPHNIFIQVGTDAGLVGLGIFLILIYRNFRIAAEIRRACRKNKEAPEFALPVARGLVITTLGFVIAGQFNTVGYYPFLWINLALMVSLAHIVRGAGEERAPNYLRREPTGELAISTARSGQLQDDLPASRSIQ